MNRMDGKLCLVTGAARGIGAAICRAFAREGAMVVVTDVDEAGGRAVADEVRGRFMSLDVAREEDWRRAESEVPAVDVVVNNAGITGLEAGGVHDPERATLADWRAVQAVNAEGVFLGCRYAIRAMKARRTGSIINIGSRSGVVGIPGAAAYAAAKAAVRNHTKSVALYCAQQGWTIRCNVIQPAAILTPMWASYLGDEGPDRNAKVAAITADAPLKRFGKVEEVAALAVVLGSDEAQYMTGAELTLDGGLLAGSAATPD